MTRSIRDISAKAVVLGGVIDIVATNVLLAPVAIVVFVGMDPSLSPAQQTAAFTEALTTNSTLYLVSLLLGCAASVLGGWSAARIARRAELVNGALSAFACVGFGIYGMIKYPDTVPLWQHVAFLVLSPALGALGALIRIRQQQSAPPKPAEAVLVPAAAPTLVGIPRYVLLANRALMAVSTLILLFFGLVGLYGHARNDRDAIIGSVILSAFALAALPLFFFGGRALRAGRAHHWALNAGGLVFTLMPLGLFILALAVSQKDTG